MGTNQLSGPVTRWLAAKLRERRKEFDLTFAEVSKVTGVPMTTAKRAFTGESGIAVEAFVDLARGLQMNPGALLSEAQRAIYSPKLTTVRPDELGVAAYVDSDPTEDEILRQEHPDDESL
ncbi:Uncharacterised protein [Acidipropionibacterium jensenii]|uniref:HTH cro/C1-type domain-containing protein n=1 Tax=Acidipropionibacterium jensenii TaxID=1749 RepID=A0A3S4W9S5_9ACTN|nr:helix-turn-helix transcriptional regulator [Acidipropionibacterium jensenii]VEI04153.1 Uncharacterised protein [Acidipropionibacterium jensenii]